ncbi:MAG: small multi-drug export protein [Desulfobulbaceae bacterium]|nr:small multi-drug export protein [Desulfobulbaceae bacterium]
MSQIRKNTRFYNTTEWWIFCAGVFLSILLVGAAWYLYGSDPEKVQVFSLVFAVHTIGGRAAGIGLCIINDINNIWTIAYNFYLEILIVCFTYSISILSINNYIKFRAVKYYSIRLERKARKYKDKIEKYGWLGLFFFVMTPLPVTGPVVGSIIGSLLKFRISKNFSATFTGTLAAIVAWTFFFDFLEEHLKVIRYILAVIIIIVLFSYARDIKNLFNKD